MFGTCDRQDIMRSLYIDFRMLDYRALCIVFGTLDSITHFVKLCGLLGHIMIMMTKKTKNKKPTRQHHQCSPVYVLCFIVLHVSLFFPPTDSLVPD